MEFKSRAGVKALNRVNPTFKNRVKIGSESGRVRSFFLSGRVEIGSGRI